MPKKMGETDFQPWEIPRSGSKAKDGEREKIEERRNGTMVITMASYALQTQCQKHTEGWGGRPDVFGTFPNKSHLTYHTSSSYHANILTTSFFILEIYPPMFESLGK